MYSYLYQDGMFQYMLLLRGATCSSRAASIVCIRFNTCSSCEEQLVAIIYNIAYKTFQYMLLLRGATDLCNRRSGHRPFQYMLLLRGATGGNRLSGVACCFNTCSSCEEQHAWYRYTPKLKGFNTCSSCEEQLSSAIRQFAGRFCFNTCSSCEEQLARKQILLIYLAFQYMLLLRGATPRF